MSHSDETLAQRDKNEISLDDDLREIKPLVPYRRLLDDGLRLSSGKHNLHVIGSCDISKFTEFSRQCVANRQRPPSLVAYFARCVGVVLSENPERMASLYKDKLLVPRHVNIVLTVVTGAGGDEGIPLLMPFEKVDEKNLAEISREMTDAIRALRRRAVSGEKGYKMAMGFASLPVWMRRGIYTASGLVPKWRRGMAKHLSSVFITSITQFSGGRGGWGFPITPYSLGFTIGGMSKRPWVVDDQVVVRECLDVTITVDHIITDGGNACILATKLGDELESGRVLAEFEVAPPRSKRAENSATLRTPTDLSP